MFLRIILFFLLLGAPLFSFAQVQLELNSTAQKGQNQFFRVFSGQVKQNTLYRVEFPAVATGLSIEISPAQSFAGAFLVTGRDTIYLKADVHVTEGEGGMAVQKSNLVVFENPTNQVQFFSGSIAGEVMLHHINAGGHSPATKPAGEPVKKKGDSGTERTGNLFCNKPATVDQAVWRAGLPAPSFTPIQTQVRHMIVHHSATSNNVTDYYSVVRNIYIYHTSSNGWDDIGYNYLVAPDGTIFEGREDFDTFGEDNVQGAHLCAKNARTMGVCMIGSYDGIALPTDTSIASLTALLTWKTFKDNLTADSSYLHPINNPNAQPLGVIAGHRDGCATVCPGDNVYSRLPGVRTDVKTNADLCRSVASVDIFERKAQKLSLVPNPASTFVQLTLASGEGNIRSVKVYTMTGTVVKSQYVPFGQPVMISLSNMVDGIYFVSVETSRGRYNAKLIVNK